MKFIILMVFILLGSNAYAQNQCSDGECDKALTEADKVESQQLPADALAEVEKLRIEMRFFTSIGLATTAKEKKDAITAIYQNHGVAIPEGLLEF